ELRRTLPVADSTDDRNVRQFPILLDTPQHQPAAAHVAPPDEFLRKREPAPECFQQHVHVLSRGDAAEQDDLAATRGAEEFSRAVLERLTVADVGALDIDLAEG